MPLYTYACQNCNKYFELLIKLADYGKKVNCKYCNKPLQKMVDAPAFKVN